MRSPTTAVILNYNNAAETIECVRSLERSTYPNLSILVVDNGSTDGSEQLIRGACPGVEILQTGRNLGFAAGNNAGIARALARGAAYVLILNNDTLVDPHFLEPMVEALEADHRAAAAGGTICYHPETEKVWYAGGSINPWRASAFVHHLDAPYASLDLEHTVDVSFITGCMMLVRAVALATAGTFDERFFMYLEDTNLCARLQSHGYRLLYVPRTRIYHRIKHRGDRPLTMYYMVRNRLLFVSEVPRALQRWGGTLYLYATLAAKMPAWLVTNRALSRAAWMGVVDFRARRLHQGRGLSLA